MQRETLSDTWVTEPWVYSSDPYWNRVERISWLGQGPCNGYKVETGLEEPDDADKPFIGAVFEKLWSAIHFQRAMEGMGSA